MPNWLQSPSLGPVLLGTSNLPYCSAPVTFVALNLLSLSLVFGNLTTAIICIPLVLTILAWHARPIQGSEPKTV